MRLLCIKKFKKKPYTSNIISKNNYVILGYTVIYLKTQSISFIYTYITLLPLRFVKIFLRNSIHENKLPKI